MPKNYKYIFLLLLTLASCEKKPKNNYENIILGDWIFEKESPKKENRFYSDFGYSFNKNGNCESKPGFYETSERDKNGDRKTIFYGTKTKFKIVDDSLFINNLITKKWDAAKIVSITSKSLKISFDKNIILELSKQEYIENRKDDFDKIIISKSPCFGSCPINDIEINKNGEVTYSGGHWNLRNGFFKSKITSQEFKEIENNFKKAKFLELKNDYSASWTDDQEITVTFVKDNKILKTIKDYGRQSPKSFRITLEPITYLYQKLKLEENKEMKEFGKIQYYRFEKGNKIINLTGSEAFYLSNLLSNSETTNKTFVSEYFIDYDTDLNVNRIETDGRFFKIISKDKSSIILDLGFNFIMTNELTKRLKLKTKYD